MKERQEERKGRRLALGFALGAYGLGLTERVQAGTEFSTSC